MTEGAWTSWRDWPKPLKLSASLIVGALGLTTVYTISAGTPTPVLPSSALFEPVSVLQTLSLSRPELSSSDFVLRPVFALDRKPRRPDLLSENDAALVASEADAVESIDGINLLGIFGSGEVAGAIIRLDNGDRQRLVVGESIKGWTLGSIESRRALLQAVTGEEARLEMVYATDQSILATEMEGESGSAIPHATATDGALSQNNDAPTQKAEPARPATRMSFENIYGGAPTQDASRRQEGNE
ncbi:hypothetical protein N9U55_01790 [Luminiphilus sp.]|nr:hypothetical protein [Luminiphilus sp.]MDA9721995.1 hypothetical protein [Luminiphilus sp.]